MDGAIDWAALPVVCELLGIDDIDRLLADLVNIRTFQKEKHG